MKKALKIIAAVVVLAFVGIQFVRPERTNPPVDPSRTLESNEKVPPQVQSILERSCKDCHTHKTEWPFYSNIAPVSWSVTDHVNHGREELNFSEWAKYSPEARERKLEEICEEVEEREMPHPQYLWIHRDAGLSQSDIRAICDWTREIGVKGEDLPEQPADIE